MELDLADFAGRLVFGMADAIVYVDAEGLIRVWNRGATRIFGFAEAEALGRSLDLIIPENLRERHWQGYRATMRTGQSRYGDGQLLSIPAVRKDGTRVSVEVHHRAVYRRCRADDWHRRHHARRHCTV
jgi:PAS domain S-box-containing protein